MNGETLILYVITPAVIIVTILFAIAAIILMRNNLSTTKDIAQKQGEIFDLNQNIDGKVTNIEDVISNQIVPSISYIKTGVEELTFAPSIELIEEVLNELGIEWASITEDGQALAFGVGTQNNEITVGYIVHYIKQAEIILFQSISKQLTLEQVSDKTLVYLMKTNSEMLVGNVYVQDMKSTFPIMCNYSFKANKSNIDKNYFGEVIKRLAATHIEVDKSLKELGIESKSIDINDYLETHNSVAKEANKAN